MLKNYKLGNYRLGSFVVQKRRQIISDPCYFDDILEQNDKKILFLYSKNFKIGNWIIFKSIYEKKEQKMLEYSCINEEILENFNNKYFDKIFKGYVSIDTGNIGFYPIESFLQQECIPYGTSKEYDIEKDSFTILSPHGDGVAKVFLREHEREIVDVSILFPLFQ